VFGSSDRNSEQYYQRVAAPGTVLVLLAKSDLQSLDFCVNGFFIKLFTTKSIETVKYCREYFDFSLPSVLWAKRVAKFEVSFGQCFLSVL